MRLKWMKLWYEINLQLNTMKNATAGKMEDSKIKKILAKE